MARLPAPLRALVVSGSPPPPLPSPVPPELAAEVASTPPRALAALVRTLGVAGRETAVDETAPLPSAPLVAAHGLHVWLRSPAPEGAGLAPDLRLSSQAREKAG